MKAGLGLVAGGAITVIIGLTPWIGGAVTLWLGMALLGGGAGLLASAGWRGRNSSWILAGLVTGFLVGFANEIFKDDVCDLVAERGSSWAECVYFLTEASLGIGLTVAALVAVGGMAITVRRTSAFV